MFSLSNVSSDYSVEGKAEWSDPYENVNGTQYPDIFLLSYTDINTSILNTSREKLKYHFVLQNDEGDLTGNYSLKLNTGVDVINDFFSISCIDGHPSYSFILLDSDDKEVDKFSKLGVVKLKLVDFFDNVDDSLGKSFFCGYKVDGAFKESKSFESNADGSYNGVIFSFNVSDYGLSVGNHTVELDCNDGFYQVNKTLNFEVVDFKPIIKNLTLTSGYPDEKIVCNAEAYDEDDPNANFTYTYEWYLNGIKQNITTNTFDCKGKCHSDDELLCKVKAKDNQESEFSSKSVKIKNYFTKCEISSKNTVQINDLIEFTPIFNYLGKNKINYDWVFGDGSHSTEKNPKKAYATKGNYIVLLKLSDGSSKIECSKTINVLDAGIKILFKNLKPNQSIAKGNNQEIVVYLEDNTSTPLENAKVTGQLNDINFNFNSANNGIYKANVEIPYRISSIGNLVVKAEKGSLHSVNSVPLYFEPVLLTPEFYFSDDLIENNYLKSVTVCFKYPNGDFAEVINPILIVNDLEYQGMENNSCYDFQLNLILKDKLECKFKNIRDNFDNYISSSFLQEFPVKEAPNAIELVYLTPDTLTTDANFILKVKVKKLIPLDSVKLFLITKNKEIPFNFDGNYYFINLKAPHKDNFRVKIKTVAFKNKQKLIQFFDKTFNTKNKLNINLINPKVDGKVLENNKLIVKITTLSGEDINQNKVNLKLNGKDVTFERDGNYYSANYSFDYTKPLYLDFEGAINDNKIEKTIKIDKLDPPNIPIATKVFFIKNWIWILAIIGILIIIYLVYLTVLRVSKKQKSLEEQFANKSYDELIDEFNRTKAILKEIQKKYFHRELSETEYKRLQIEYTKKAEFLLKKINSLKQNNTEFNIDPKRKEYLDLLAKALVEQYKDLETIKDYILKIPSDTLSNTEKKYVYLKVKELLN